MGFDEGDACVVDDGGDVGEYCCAPVGVIRAVGDDDVFFVLDGDLVSAEEFQGEFFDIDRAKRDL